MGTVALVTDSTAYLDAREAAALGIAVVPLQVALSPGGEDSGTSVAGLDGAEPEIDVAAFYRALRAGSRPTTSQPAPGQFLAAYEAAAAGGADRVLCVTCSATMSGTHGSATLAAGMAGLPVDVVDSGTISGGLQLVVRELARVLAGGASVDEARAVVEALRGRVWSTWSSDTTALLAAGGRLRDRDAQDAGDAGDAAGGPDGVPVLALEGEVRVLGAARSAPESVRLQAEHVLASAAVSPTHVTVGSGDVPELADALADAIEGAPGVLSVERYVVGPVVGAHTGPGSFGANYVRPPDPAAPPGGSL